MSESPDASTEPGAIDNQQLGPAMGLRDHWCGALSAEHIGQTVSVCGWVNRRREHSEHLAFIDLRDRSGLVQCVVDHAHDLRSEYVLRVTGTVRARPEGTVNPNLPTGDIEIGDCEVEVLNQAEPPPFPLDERTDVDELIRLKHRYVDLRKPRMQRLVRNRAAVNAALRRAMERQGFTEVETPLLWTPTPEGAREFIVPSRLNHGSFYVLPQSPQIAKQVLMVSGVDRYYQIAKCFRDEDLRADRQFEFTQLDVEASFVSQDDVLAFVGEAVLEATEAVRGERPVIETMTWHDAMERFGSDKPDLRFGMELVELTPLFSATEFNAFKAPCIKGICVPGGGSASRKDLDNLTDVAKSLGGKGLVWMKVGADLEITSPVAKFMSDDELRGVTSALGGAEGDLLLVSADERDVVRKILGDLRLRLGQPPVNEGPLRYVWITEFPLFEGLSDAGEPIPAHHAFTMPHHDDLEKLESDPLAVRSYAYDLVLNGWEVGGGSIRIHRDDIQRRIFKVMGISDDDAELRFGFLLGAFRYGAPPHGGCALGIDRLVALLSGEENIREIIAFPKTQSGVDPLTGAPLPVEAQALDEVGLRALPKPT